MAHTHLFILPELKEGGVQEKFTLTTDVVYSRCGPVSVSAGESFLFYFHTASICRMEKSSQRVVEE